MSAPPSESGDDVRKRLHDAKPAALCLSGGGIRSATFGLGVLQGLARIGVLEHFDYLSTVSGGGYIGSWLTSWMARRAGSDADHELDAGAWRNASKEVLADLARGDEHHPSGGQPEADEIAHLRSYSNYLTPRLGLLSADTWTLAATYLRNVIVNWFVLVPFLLAVLAVPRLWEATLALGNRAHVVQMMALLAIAGLTGLVLVVYLAVIRPVPGETPSLDDGKRRYGAMFAIFGPGMLVIQALAMCFVRAIPDQGSGGSAMWWAATWGFARRLPFGSTIVPIMQRLFRDADSALLVSLMLSVVVLNLVGWALYTVRLKRAAKGSSVFARATLECFAAIVAGAAAGWFLWLIIVRIFDDPMRNLARVPLHASDLTVESFLCFAPALYLLAFFVQTMMFVGISGKLNDDDDREWWARWAAWLLIVSIAGMALGAVATYGPLLIAMLPRTIAAIGGVTGLVTLVLGRSGASPATRTQTSGKSWQAMASNVALAAAAPVFVLVVFSGLSLVNSWILHAALQMPPVSALHLPARTRSMLEPLAIMHFSVLRQTPLDLVVGYTSALLCISLIASLFVQVNRFSMHGLYRNRLTRAYLGASNTNRHQNPFTGFDEGDNIPMTFLPRRPFHVVNMALNLVSSEKLAWQERKAASFTISPLHCGSDILGYRPSARYAHTPDGFGITLGTAMAVSGAAVSPNMGYHTSPALSFLLTLFNVRLGWWLGNPRRPHYVASGPDSSLVTILAEATGHTNENSRWVYLSDGGHFDNLGLYEMVRRRCHTIVVSDAGRDPKATFEDLGNAIRKIRIDLGIPITVDDMKIHPREPRRPGSYFAIGTIHYGVVDDGAPNGVLVYLKPSIYGQEPIDIRNYAAQNSEFPHEATSDQWFTESQFESYRALGAFIIDDICNGTPVSSIDEFTALLQTPRPQAGHSARIPIRESPQTPPPVSPMPTNDVAR
ncbi:MAG TPA: patatin-like phospholipase family protein [Thermoanaerobaculia bacterium]|nr:patatin-like phospholipase family protein [Thermoanaerobaculia bacterium]